MSRILVVEDEKDIAELIEFNLTRKGFEVTCAEDGNTALDLALNGKFSVVVLDLMLPERDGLSVLRKLRRDARTEHLPVIILSARGQTEDKIAGLTYGADDYMSKPFSPKELVLRVQKMSKKTVEVAADSDLEVGPFRLDKNKGKFYIAGEEITLTQTEQSLMRLLCEQAGTVITREDVQRSVWGYSDDVKSRTLDTHMKRLRQKLGDHASYLSTVRGVGYKVVEEA